MTTYYRENLAVNQVTHKIIVINTISVESDTKAFSICSPCISQLELLNDIKNFMTDALVTDLKPNIIIDDGTEKKTTHTIVIKDTNTKSAKSFSISAIHLSSKIIATHLQLYLWHGKLSKSMTEQEDL